MTAVRGGTALDFAGRQVVGSGQRPRLLEDECRRARGVGTGSGPCLDRARGRHRRSGGIVGDVIDLRPLREHPVDLADDGEAEGPFKYLARPDLGGTHEGSDERFGGDAGAAAVEPQATVPFDAADLQMIGLRLGALAGEAGERLGRVRQRIRELRRCRARSDRDGARGPGGDSSNDAPRSAIRATRAPNRGGSVLAKRPARPVWPDFLATRRSRCTSDTATVLPRRGQIFLCDKSH